MKTEQRTITTIVADEGKLLVRKSDGWVAGERFTLGYDYYEAGVGLAEPRLATPEDFEEIDKPEGWEETPIIFHPRRMARMSQLLEEEKREFKNRGLTAEEMITHRSFAPKWGVDEGFREGDAVVKGDKFTFDDKLWAVLQDHTIQAIYPPSINTAALYVEVTPEYTEEGEGLGTLDNPIPYDGNMVLENGKYYAQSGVTYLCTRDSENPVYHALADLVGLYVEVV